MISRVLLLLYEIYAYQYIYKCLFYDFEFLSTNPLDEFSLCAASRMWHDGTLQQNRGTLQLQQHQCCSCHSDTAATEACSSRMWVRYRSERHPLRIFRVPAKFHNRPSRGNITREFKIIKSISVNTIV